MSDFPWSVGDQFEGSSIELGRYISEIMAVGGKFEFIDGKVIQITYLPFDNSPPSKKPAKVVTRSASTTSTLTTSVVHNTETVAKPTRFFQRKKSTE